MREIKFRAWDKKNKQWLWANGALGEHFTTGNIYAGWELNVKPEVELMQFTSLKDKNGKEIYEGDVVIGLDKRDIPCQGWVEWMPHMLTYVLRDKSCKTEREWLIQLGWSETEEVIGNIYENPDLLK